MKDVQITAASSLSSRKQQIAVAIILVVLLCLSIWLVMAIRGERSLTWTEEVKFPDGRVVVLTRHQEFRDREYDPGDYWFEYINPDTGEKIRFESSRAFATMALFKQGNDTFLLLNFAYGQTMYDAYNCPNPPYILKRYRGVWIDIDLTEIPIKKLAVNMTYNVFGDLNKIKDSKNHLTVMDTQNFIYKLSKPYVIDFGLMQKQTFGNENCRAPNDDLISP